MNRIIAMLVSVVMAFGMLIASTSTASAHTPNVYAKCTGIEVYLTAYADSQPARDAEGYTEREYTKTVPAVVEKQTLWAKHNIFGTPTGETKWAKNKPSATVGSWRSTGKTREVELEPKKVMTDWFKSDPQGWTPTGKTRFVETKPAQDAKTNTVTVSINGAVSMFTFGTSFNRTFPVPQDGAITEWSVVVDAHDGDQYDVRKSGTVGPCGEKPKPEKPDALVVNGEWADGDFVCTDTEVIQTRTVTTTEYVFDTESWTWVAGEPVVTEQTQTRPLTEEESTCPVIPEEPEPPVVTPESPVTPEPPVDNPQPPVTDTPKPDAPQKDVTKPDSPKKDIGTPVHIEKKDMTKRVAQDTLPNAGGPSIVAGIAAVLALIVGGVLLFRRKR